MLGQSLQYSLNEVQIEKNLLINWMKLIGQDHLELNKQGF